MSDFIYSRKKLPCGLLGANIKDIYNHNPPVVVEFHGVWGSLAVSHGFYSGFDPIETDDHICVILGGPILKFSNNLFIRSDNKTAGTQLLLEKWLSPTSFKWDADVSGPFVALKIDKHKNRVDLITDLMSFIPVFYAEKEYILGTHVDAVAKVGGLDQQRDAVSIADFILNGIVTYPHTIYQGINQIAPGSEYTWSCDHDSMLHVKTYWEPREEIKYATPADAAKKLGDGLKEYVESITASLDKVALFLSGGEDSRTILGMIPDNCQRDAFIFLENMNREGRVAQNAAKAFGANFKCIPRTDSRYLDVLPACAELVGSGAQYTHVHSYKLHEVAQLDTYRAVFGGFLSDAFFKGSQIKKMPIERFGVYFQFKAPYTFIEKNKSKNNFQDKIMESLKARVDKRKEELSKIRNISSLDEWFHIYPISMDTASPHFWGQRRLFASYEPFTSHAAVKISASMPQHWKLNRVAFQKMSKTFLEPAKHLAHADGWLPYYSWKVNLFYRPMVKIKRRIERIIGINRGNQGPWNNWVPLLESPAWKDFASDCVANADFPNGIFKTRIGDLFGQDKAALEKNINLIQMLYQCRRVK
ncbi:MAG: hypothetical protein IBX57_11835 [Gammaproteobacteria bacterium]|nr:hypothetical protein [Gammaproteobacteria bacterium]